MKGIALICMVLSQAAPGLGQTRPGESASSVDDVRALFEQQEFSQVIRQATRMLAVKTTPQSDRHELLVFKAESHLRLGDAKLAAKAFDEAAVSATDLTSAARARTMAMLIARSKRNLYHTKFSPEGALSESYPIIEADGRRLALKALYSDECVSCQKLLSAAQQTSDLARLLEGLEATMLLKDLELAATGGDADSQGRLEPLAERASGAMEQQLKKTTARVGRLHKDANKKRKMGSAYRKRGLSEEEKAELRAEGDSCMKLSDAASRFADVCADPQPFTDITRKAQELTRLIDQTLSADYTKLYDRN